METITLRLEGDTIESLDDEAEEHDVSRSEYIRDIIDRRDEHERIQTEYENQIDKLENKIDELEREVERLQNEKETIIQQREEHAELVEYVDEERSWREQPLSVRFKWWLFGKK